MKKTLLILVALGLLTTARAAIVVLEFDPPTNAVAAGIHDYTATAKTITLPEKQQWLAAPPIGSTNCEFDTSVLPAIPCMIAMQSNGTNGQHSAYCDWILFDTNTAPAPVITNAVPPALLPPTLLRWHYK